MSEDFRRTVEAIGEQQRTLSFDRMRFKIQAAVHALGPDIVEAAFRIEPYLDENLRVCAGESGYINKAYVARCASCPVAMFLSDKSNLNVWVDGSTAFAMPPREIVGSATEWQDNTTVRLPLFISRLISRIDRMEGPNPALMFSLEDLKVGMVAS